MRRSVLVILIVLAQAGLSAQARPTGQARLKAGATINEHWVPTWGTAQQLIRTPPPAPPATLPAATTQPAPTATTPATPPPFRVTTLNNQTVRMILRTSIGGSRVRVKLSNAFAMPTVVVGSAHVARRGAEAGIAAGSDRALTFGGKSSFTLMPVEVVAPEDAAAIVAFGDSITDGARSTPDTNHSWPALLAARLAANKATAQIGIVNEGIGGNRLLTDASGLAGVSALARFDHDVLSHPSVKWLMILEGINDIGSLANPAANAPVTGDDLIWVLKEMVARAHAQGIKVVGCTLTPYGGAGYARDEGEAMRATVNQWIRTSGTFDAVVDFEAATRDAADPKKFRPEFDPGDHLHPNNAGYEAMANAVDLSIFGTPAKKKSK